ncbi:hypothetical protein [Gordonia iterans]
MIGVLVAGVLGGGVGSVVIALIDAKRLFRVTCPDPDAHELTEDDREAVASEFAAHASAVQRQVSEYADVLAGGDVGLRERLRRFEGGDRP